MNAELQTNDRSKHLLFRSIQRSSDRSAVCFTLVVRSFGFQAEGLFSVEPEPWDAFLEQLERIDAELRGEALLKPLSEEVFVKLQVTRTGGVIVNGLVEASGQRLEFSFDTDQTCLAPLLTDLRAGSIAQIV